MVDLIAQHIGALVKAEMASQRCTQMQLARRLNVSQAAVSRRLMGDVEFTVGELIAAAEFLRVPAAAFLPAAVA